MTHNPKFSYCYSYTKGEHDNSIQFDAHIFSQLMYRILLTFESDMSFCYVISKLCDFARFKKIARNALGPSRTRSAACKPASLTVRDIKFLIWVLTQSRYPKEKVLRFELGEKIFEIDNAQTIKSNYSFNQWNEISRNFRKTSYFDAQKIKTPNFEKNKRDSPKMESKVVPDFEISHVESISKIHFSQYNRPPTGQIDFPERSRCELSLEFTRGPIQECEDIPGYSYKLKESKLNKTVKKTKQSKNSQFGPEQTCQLSEKEVIQQRKQYFSAETVSAKTRNKTHEQSSGSKAAESRQNGFPTESESSRIESFIVNFRNSSSNQDLAKRASSKGDGRDVKTMKKKRNADSRFSNQSGTMKTAISLDKVISNLKRLSIKTKEITTLGELEEKNEMLFDMPKKSNPDLESTNCPCKLCKKVKLRKPKIAINIKTFVREQAELSKDPRVVSRLKLSNRLKKNAKPRKVEADIVDPYAKKKKLRSKRSKKPHLKLDKKYFNSNQFKKSGEDEAQPTVQKISDFENNFVVGRCGN